MSRKQLFNLRVKAGSLLVVPLCFLLFSGVVRAGVPEAASNKSETPLWEQGAVSPDRLNIALESWKKRVDELPKEATENSFEGKQRLAWKERIARLLEWKEILERGIVLQEELESLSSSRDEVVRQIELEEKKANATAPKKPTPQGLEEIRALLEQSQKELEADQQKIKERSEVVATLSERSAAYKERLKSVRRDAEQYTDMAKKKSGIEQQILFFHADNARLSMRVAEEGLKLLAEEQRSQNEAVPLRDKKHDLLQLQNRWNEQAFTLYQEALNRFQASLVEQKAAELVEKTQSAQMAVRPDERFLTKWEAEIARVQKYLADLNKLKTDLLSLISEQEKLLKSDQDELVNLQELVKKNGISDGTAHILKGVFHRLEYRRKSLNALFSTDAYGKLAGIRARSAEINTELLDLRARWRAELDGIGQELDERSLSRLEKNADPLLKSYRDLLGKEKQLLLEVEGAERRLSLYPLEREEALLSLETFVRSKVFWIQDADLIGLKMIDLMLRETFSPYQPNSLFNWWRETLSKETVSHFYKALGEPSFLLLFLVLAVGFPLGYLPLRHRWKKADQQAKEINLRPTASDLAWTIVVRISLIPLYLFLLSQTIAIAGLPASIGVVTQRVLLHVALFFLGWGLNRHVVHPTGVLVNRFKMPEAVSATLFSSFRLILLVYLAFLLPWIIFKDAPFNFIALPRLGNTLFELAAAIAIFPLIRPTSPLVVHTFGFPADLEGKTGSILPKQPVFIGRHWSFISKLITLFMISVIGLDIMGFRFGASHLASNGLLTLFTLFSLIGLYHGVAALVEKMITSRRRIPTATAPGGKRTESRSEFVGQVQGSLRLLFMVAGAFLFAQFWGLNKSVFHVLSEYVLYSSPGVDGTFEFVTLADLTRFLIGLVFLVWVTRHLPKLFELILFSRIPFDAGMRYAIVTMSRYLIFLIGLFITFSFLKLDLAKVGWLVAAISVGLGFGLQEIVANFVSGIILLIERPIRVGDLITVGQSFGRVTRINIRSTTILTPDIQELLIPNRDLITREVTNWTLANSNIRLVVPIGVAYGSDIGRVITVLNEVARAQPEVLKDPPVEVLFMLHGASSLDFELRVFLPNPTLRMAVLSRLNTAINKAFAENNIEIPFPQQDIHIRSGLITETANLGNRPDAT
ncbi:MAG: mechanosensitive ion channel [Magnetococcales bacterium]|nr:mechanosensitive ion channel [Magnetococcales bacterium]